MVYPQYIIIQMDRSFTNQSLTRKLQQPIKLEQLNDDHILLQDQQQHQQGPQNPFCYDEDEMQQVYQQQKQSNKHSVKLKFDSSDNQTRHVKKYEDVPIYTEQDHQQFQKQQKYVAKIKREYKEAKEKLKWMGNQDEVARISQESLNLQKQLDQIIHRVDFKQKKKQPVVKPQDVVLDQPIELLKYEGIIPSGKYSMYNPSNKSEPASLQNRLKFKMSEKKLEQIIEYFKKYEEFLKDKNKGYQRKMSLKKFAIEIGIDPSRIYQFYYDFLMDPTLSQKFLCIREVSRRSSANNITLNRMRKLKQWIKVNPFITQNQMMEKLMAEPDCQGNESNQLQKPMISRLLKSMNYSKKKILRIPKLKNTPINVEKRYHFSVEYKRIKEQQRAIIYYFDECAFNLFTMRDMAWSQRGQPIEYRQATPISRNVSLSLIINSTGIQQWQIKKGAFKKHHIMAFLQKFFKKIEARGQYKFKQYLLFDNCAIHDYEQIKSLAAKHCKMTVMLLPPYTPQMNPIETWFHDMKVHVRKGTHMTEEQLILEINKIVKKYKGYDFSNYYAGLLVHAQRGIKKQKF